jgi:ribonuclease HI
VSWRLGAWSIKSCGFRPAFTAYVDLSQDSLHKGACSPRKPEVTIFADASHDDRARVAGWGAWIKADGHISVTCGAAMKTPVGSVTEAELCALANALTVARLRGLLATGCIVMLQSDSVSALAIIRCKIADVGDRPVPGGLAVAAARRVKLTQLLVAAIAVISEIVAALKLSLVTRHVRGHRPGPGRQWRGRPDRHARPPAATRRGRSSDKVYIESENPHLLSRLLGQHLFEDQHGAERAIKKAKRYIDIILG